MIVIMLLTEMMTKMNPAPTDVRDRDQVTDDWV